MIFTNSHPLIAVVRMDVAERWPVESLVDGAKLGVRMTGDSEFRMFFLYLLFFATQMEAWKLGLFDFIYR